MRKFTYATFIVMFFAMQVTTFCVVVLAKVGMFLATAARSLSGCLIRTLTQRNTSTCVAYLERLTSLRGALCRALPTS